jgi:hypothetical protein
MMKGYVEMEEGGQKLAFGNFGTYPPDNPRAPVTLVRIPCPKEPLAPVHSPDQKDADLAKDKYGELVSSDSPPTPYGRTSGIPCI